MGIVRCRDLKDLFSKQLEWDTEVEILEQKGVWGHYVEEHFQRMK